MAKRMTIEAGARYGSLTVLEQADDYISPSGNHSTQFKCRCDCGNEIITRGTYLKIGKTKACKKCSYQQQAQNRIRDLTGCRFGRWTVISRFNSDRPGVYWKCLCDCGNEGVIRGTSLTSGNSTSCGCFALEKLRDDHRLDLSGKTFYRLTVICRVDDFVSPINGKHRSRWKCRCECGKIVEVNGSDLTSGNTHSCGCYKLDKTSETHFQDLSGRRFGMLTVIKRVEDYVTLESGRSRPQFLCRCDCGNEKIIQKDSLMNGTISCGCINSRGEREIAEFLRANNISFEVQYSFADLKGVGDVLLHFDFAIKDLSGNLLSLIEYQGEQHFVPIPFFGGETKYEKQSKNDDLKRKYCKEHEIILIEIPYDANICDYLKNTLSFK